MPLWQFLEYYKSYWHIVLLNQLSYKLINCQTTLWPNAYKNNTTAFVRQQLANRSTKFRFAPGEQRGFIDSLHFMMSGRALQWTKEKEPIDICKVLLSEPPVPRDTALIKTPFIVKLPG